MMNPIFIPGQIPSLKNSKVMGRFPSKTVTKWLRTFGISSYNARRKEVNFFKTIIKQHDFLKLCEPIKECQEYPIKLGFHFIRRTKADWDFNNCNHILTDLMTAFDIIPDDAVKYILPFPLEIDGKYWKICQENPGVIIKIL